MTDKTPRDRLKDGLNEAAKNYKGMWSKPDTWFKPHTTLGKGYEETNNTEHNDK